LIDYLFIDVMDYWIVSITWRIDYCRLANKLKNDYIRRKKSFIMVTNISSFFFFVIGFIFFNKKQTQCSFAMAPDDLSTFIFEIIFILSRPMYLSRHVIIKTLILKRFYFYLLPCYHRLLLLLLSSRCSSSFLHCFSTESIVFWFLFTSSCGYLLLSHILILLCVILIVYQVHLY
jgi:hypothetical protein